MKFQRLRLDESVFDDFSMPNVTTPTHQTSMYDIDDDFCPPEYIPKMEIEHSPENVPEGPREGVDTGIADMLISAINDEWETIKKYNSLIATLRAESASNPSYEGMVAVITEINNEETRHVGQLQELLKNISPNVSSIDEGEKEAKSQFNFVDGKLQIEQMPDRYAPAVSTPNNEISDICTIADVDDEM